MAFSVSSNQFRPMFNPRLPLQSFQRHKYPSTSSSIFQISHECSLPFELLGEIVVNRSSSDPPREYPVHGFFIISPSDLSLLVAKSSLAFKNSLQIPNLNQQKKPQPQMQIESKGAASQKTPQETSRDKSEAPKGTRIQTETQQNPHKPPIISTESPKPQINIPDIPKVPKKPPQAKEGPSKNTRNSSKGTKKAKTSKAEQQDKHQSNINTLASLFESQKEMEMMKGSAKSCSCTSFHCVEKQCTCFGTGNKCSILCECTDCQNRPSNPSDELNKELDKNLRKRQKLLQDTEQVQKKIQEEKVKLEADKAQLTELLSSLYKKN
jgi:Tesmin/TSO1-like CXC domain, cysteine-rich domain